MVASHKKLLKLYTVGSPEYRHISAILKTVERLHRITARLPLEDIDGANPEAPEDTGRPSTSSTRASHSHGQRATSHQVVNRADLPPPPRASPALEFPPPPHASPSPEIPPRTAHAVSDLEISLPTAHASFHPEIPSHTSHTFFDPAHLSFTPPSFDLGPDFSQTPPVMHTQSLSYSIGHIDHVVGLQSPLPGRPKRTIKAPPCGTGGHKAGHNTGPTQREEPHEGDAVPPPPQTRHYTRQHKRMDGTGLGLVLHHKALGKTLVRCQYEFCITPFCCQGFDDIIPRDTLLWKLKLLKSTAAYANSRIHAVKAEVLVLASGKDNMLPSRDEAERLKNSLQDCVVRHFKDNGHTLLLVDNEVTVSRFVYIILT
uniref:Uncharacterized protein n=1 Tax=Quercus lobata TaxID=97700 RepID=A0A7N2L5X6_QUELO